MPDIYDAYSELLESHFDRMDVVGESEPVWKLKGQDDG